MSAQLKLSLPAQSGPHIERAACIAPEGCKSYFALIEHLVIYPLALSGRRSESHCIRRSGNLGGLLSELVAYITKLL